MIKVKVNNILESKERNIKWLSNKCNLSYSTIYNFCMGKTSAVSYNVVEAVCDVLECKIEDILEIVKD